MFRGLEIYYPGYRSVPVGDVPVDLFRLLPVGVLSAVEFPRSSEDCLLDLHPLLVGREPLYCPHDFHCMVYMARAAAAVRRLVGLL